MAIKLSGFKINRTAYIIGNMLPDINCIYPAHRLSTTENKMYKKLVKIDNTDNYIIKSLKLGIINHYICDYFCYAHVIESIGMKHKRYETNLYKYYTEHIGEITNIYKLKDLWKNRVGNTKDKYDNKYKLTLESIKYMSKSYKDIMETSINWELNTKQFSIDTEFIGFMSETINQLIMNRFICICLVREN